MTAPEGSAPLHCYWLSTRRDRDSEYLTVLLTRSTLEALPGALKRAADAWRRNMREDFVNAPAVCFKTYGRDSIWATSPSGFLFIPVIDSVDATSLVMRKDETSTHYWSAAKITDISKLVANPEGTIPIHRMISPVHCTADLATLREILEPDTKLRGP